MFCLRLPNRLVKLLWLNCLMSLSMDVHPEINGIYGTVCSIYFLGSPNFVAPHNVNGTVVTSQHVVSNNGASNWLVFVIDYSVNIQYFIWWM
ncbi:hypothetical protein V1515DRAFT_335921 [Lipomyces mesembrius]